MDAQQPTCENRVPDRTPNEAIVGRGARAGSLAGLVTGAVVGTLLFPLIGTIVGLAVGAVVGLILGVVDALVLAALTDLLTTRLRAAGATAVIAAFTGWPLPAAFDPGWWQGMLGAAVVCAAIGAVVGPWVLLGDRRW